ncbi:hypothetical protein CB599_11705 [Salmonella enterica subsp. enterica serovar Adjame]|nr:hypothetical protein [Salmonella enterica subsp. enterica serovar Adjame]
MEFIKSELLKPGDPTLCAPLEFVQAVQQTSPLHQHTTAEQMQRRYTDYFESLYRFEYRVIDNGRLLAMMVITAEDQELETGGIVMFPTIAHSLKPGLLTGGYRWLFQLAKEHQPDFILITKSNGYEQNQKIIPVKCKHM